MEDYNNRVEGKLGSRDHIANDFVFEHPFDKTSSSIYYYLFDDEIFFFGIR